MTFGPNQVLKSVYISDAQKPVFLLQTDICLQAFDRDSYGYKSTEPVINLKREPYFMIGLFKRNENDYVYWIEQSTKP